MVTLRDVAKQSGVSVATASRVVGSYGYVSQATRSRVLDAVVQLGYRPNALARSMIKRATNTIGLIIADISNPYYTDIVRGVEDTAKSYGYSVILCNSDENSLREKEYLDALLSKQVDGIIIAPTPECHDHLSVVQQTGTPLVLVDRQVKGCKVDTVKVASKAGAFEAASYLLELGHQRIGVIVGEKAVSTSKEHVDGYKQALTQYALPFSPALVFYSDSKESGGYLAARTLMRLAQPPTALFCASNLLVMGALAALSELKLSIPDDVSLLAYDDMSWMRLTNPALTVLRTPTYQMGEAAVDLLLKRVMGTAPQHPQVVQLQASLVVRTSCADRDAGTCGTVAG